MGEVRTTRSTGYRSLFWPFLLIGIGTTWLLTNIGVFQAENIAVLARLWPLLLIFAGVDLLFSRSSPTLGAVIGIVAIGGMLLLMLVGPSLGLVNLQERSQELYAEAVAGAESAEILLQSGVNKVLVRAGSSEDTLFEADLRYLGDLNYEVSGEASRKITLTEDTDGSYTTTDSFIMSLFGVDQRNEDGFDWTVELNTGVPIDLNIDTGVGETSLELGELQLSNLVVKAGVGAVDITLPGNSGSYSVDIDGGVGEINLTLPEGVAVKLDADVGVGSLDVPSNLKKVSGDDSKFVGEDGVWQTDGFDSAESQITIKFNGGVGSLKVR